jgi:hypothetical protein
MKLVGSKIDQELINKKYKVLEELLGNISLK